MIVGFLAHFRRLWTTKKPWVIVVAALGASGVLLGAARYTSKSPVIPTFVVTRGDFIDSMHFRGEIKALKSVSMAVPADAGDYQILKIVPDGSFVKRGDIVVEFDKTRVEQDLAQYRSALKSAQAEIDQARAQARLTEEDDLTAVLKAKYDVESARLDVSKQEVVSKIEGDEAKLKLADAEQKLAEAEQTLKSDRASNQATIEGKVKASQKAAFDVKREEHSLAHTTLTAPLSGLVSLVPVWHAQNQTPFKAGDRAWPGAPIAEMPDLSSLRVSARVEETERSRLAPRQPVTIHVDALPDHDFKGRVEQISTIATSDFSGGWPFSRNFDLRMVLDQPDSRLKPGMTAQVDVIVEKISNALTIPVQASFQRSGQTVAYVWTGSKFEERVIEIGRRSGDRILVVKGLRPDDRVALSDPSARE